MSELSVQPVTTRRQRKQFINLPWEMYRDDPCWIPPLIQDFKERVGFVHSPFYEDAEGQAFLACRGGRPVGRVHAIINHAHDRYHNEKRGFFGFFECEENQETADALFDAARQWLAERDHHAVRGPVNPSLNYECGLLIEGFDDPPMFMMTYNKPYYDRLISRYGFTKAQDLYAFWGHIEMIGDLDPKLQFVVDEATKRFGVSLRRMNHRRFYEEIETFLNIYNSSLGGTWGFVPLSKSEVRHMARAMRYLIVPEMTSVAIIDGEIIGAVFGMLDYNERIKKINGRLFPFGFIRLLWNRRSIPRVRLISANVTPKYQAWGIGLVLMNRLVPEARAIGVKEGEFSWVLESNHLSRRTLERGGAQRTKTYRIYDYDYGES